MNKTEYRFELYNKDDQLIFIYKGFKNLEECKAEAEFWKKDYNAFLYKCVKIAHTEEYVS
jgi:hypothetical protein